MITPFPEPTRLAQNAIPPPEFRPGPSPRPRASSFTSRCPDRRRDDRGPPLAQADEAAHDGAPLQARRTSRPGGARAATRRVVTPRPSATRSGRCQAARGVLGFCKVHAAACAAGDLPLAWLQDPPPGGLGVLHPRPGDVSKRSYPRRRPQSGHHQTPAWDVNAFQGTFRRRAPEGVPRWTRTGHPHIAICPMLVGTRSARTHRGQGDQRVRGGRDVRTTLPTSPTSGTHRDQPPGARAIVPPAVYVMYGLVAG